MTRKPRSHVRILLNRMCAIVLKPEPRPQKENNRNRTGNPRPSYLNNFYHVRCHVTKNEDVLLRSTVNNFTIFQKQLSSDCIAVY